MPEVPTERRVPLGAAISRLGAALVLGAGAALGGACTSPPTEVESRRRQKDEIEADEENARILAALRDESSEYPEALLEAVEELTSADFTIATGAERTLVAAGREAFPVLAAAEGLTASVLGSLVDPVAAVINQIHRRETVSHVLEDLEAPSPAVRVSAAEILAERDEVQAIPSLVANLRDEDPEVVSAIAMALSRLSRRYFGPFDAGTEAEREALFRRIESWFLYPNGEGPGAADSARRRPGESGT